MSAAVPPRPDVAPPAPWEFPVPRRTRLDAGRDPALDTGRGPGTGLTVLAFHVPGQHVLSVRLGIPAPLSSEPTGLEGVALIMARCIDEGSQRHTAEELAELMERRGIALGCGIGERGVVVDVDVAAPHLEPALELLTECLTEPTFPDREVRRHVRHRLADIAHELADPASRAALEFITTYFDPTDRASRPSGGSRSSVAAVTPESVRAFHRVAVQPDGATLVVAGDLAGVDLDGAIGRTVGAWSAPGPAEALARQVQADPGVRAPDAGRTVFVDRPGSVQTELYVGRPGPARRDPFGWGTYQVLSLVLGGSPQSRIDRVLREDKGYTYGIRAVFRPRASTGVLAVSGSVRAEVTAPALEALMEVLELTGSDLTDTELADAAAYVARTAPGRYATADAVAAEAVSLALDGLDTAFVSDSLAQARALDPSVARDAWDAHRQQPWTIVLVGDAAAHADAVSALGVGPVTVVPAEEGDGQRGSPRVAPSPAEVTWGWR